MIVKSTKDGKQEQETSCCAQRRRGGDLSRGAHVVIPSGLNESSLQGSLGYYHYRRIIVTFITVILTTSHSTPLLELELIGIILCKLESLPRLSRKHLCFCTQLKLMDTSVTSRSLWSDSLVFFLFLDFRNSHQATSFPFSTLSTFLDHFDRMHSALYLNLLLRAPAELCYLPRRR